MRRYAPVYVLFALAPLVAEFLFGATPLSRIIGLLPESLLYGGGAVLIREAARRRSSGWGRIAVLGAAYAIVEEGLVIQSLFNPDLFDAGLLGGRALDVNWVWTQWCVGYHAVWSIMIPILLTELLFSERRAEPWLGTKGMIITGVLYVLGAVTIGAIFRFVIAPTFSAPLLLMLGAALIVVVLAVAAWCWPVTVPCAVDSPLKRVPSPWLIGGMAAATAVAWFALFALPDVLKEGALVCLPMITISGLVAGVATLIRRWRAPDHRWTAQHQLALAGGALLVSMVFGFFFVTASNQFDQISQGVTSIAAISLLAWFAWRLRERREGVSGAAEQEVRLSNNAYE